MYYLFTVNKMRFKVTHSCYCFAFYKVGPTAKWYTNINHNRIIDFIPVCFTDLAKKEQDEKRDANDLDQHIEQSKEDNAEDDEGEGIAKQEADNEAHGGHASK